MTAPLTITLVTGRMGQSLKTSRFPIKNSSDSAVTFAPLSTCTVTGISLILGYTSGHSSYASCSPFIFSLIRNSLVSENTVFIEITAAFSPSFRLTVALRQSVSFILLSQMSTTVTRFPPLMCSVLHFLYLD